MFNEEQALHGGQAVTLGSYVMTSQFWFDSFQNWQSEFLSVGVFFIHFPAPDGASIQTH